MARRNRYVGSGVESRRSGSRQALVSRRKNTRDGLLAVSAIRRPAGTRREDLGNDARRIVEAPEADIQCLEGRQETVAALSVEWGAAVKPRKLVT